MKKYAVVLILIIAGIAAWAKQKTPAETEPQTVVAVHTLQANIKPLPYVYNTTGTVEPLQEVNVRPQLSGRLVAVLFKEGDIVKEGDLLAQIDDASVKAALNQARAELAVNRAKLREATANLQRYKQLRQSSIVSQKALEAQESQYEQLRGAVQSGQAQVDMAQINYNHARITAPISGRIGFNNIKKGNLVSSTDTQPIASITQVSPISVVFALPQNLLSALRQEAIPEVIVSDSATGDKLGVGKVSAFDNEINPQTGTLRVRAEVVNDAGNLWAGQLVTVGFSYGRSDNRVVLPSPVVRSGLDGSFVFKNIDGRAVVSPVEVGYTDDNHAEILSGLSAGDSVISDNFALLTDGTPVQPILNGDE